MPRNRSLTIYSLTFLLSGQSLHYHEPQFPTDITLDGSELPCTQLGLQSHDRPGRAGCGQGAPELCGAC